MSDSGGGKPGYHNRGAWFWNTQHNPTMSDMHACMGLAILCVSKPCPPNIYAIIIIVLVCVCVCVYVYIHVLHVYYDLSRMETPAVIINLM